MDAVLARYLHRARRRMHRFRAAAAHAARRGYAGWLVVEAEQDPRTAHPLTYARLGYRNLRAVVEEAGFMVA